MERTKNRIHTAIFTLLLALAMTAVVGCRSTQKTTLPGAMTLKELKNIPAYYNNLGNKNYNKLLEELEARE